MNPIVGIYRFVVSSYPRLWDIWCGGFLILLAVYYMLPENRTRLDAYLEWMPTVAWAVLFVALGVAHISSVVLWGRWYRPRLVTSLAIVGVWTALLVFMVQVGSLFGVLLTCWFASGCTVAALRLSAIRVPITR